MSSLDVLDYQTGLEAALAKRGPEGKPLLEPALRRQAMRDVRRTIDALAFRFALIDERPLPEDLDYIRALEGLKAPDDVARVLAKRRPIYVRTRRRRLATTWTMLAVFALFAAGIAYAATLESADTLAEVNVAQDEGDVLRTFTVPEGVSRLYVAATVIVQREGGPVTISLVDPDGREHLGEAGYGAQFYTGDGNYLRENIPTPAAGNWTLLVSYGNGGSVSVRVDAVTPNR